MRRAGPRACARSRRAARSSLGGGRTTPTRCPRSCASPPARGPARASTWTADGVFVFESRHHRLLAARSTLSQGEFAGAGAAALLASPFGYDPGLRDVINECAIVVEDREEPAVAEAVWTLPGEVMLPPGESRVYVVTAPDPFLDAVTPVAGTDFVIVAGALAMMALDRTSGQSVALTLTAGGSGARLMGLQVRARPVRVVGRTRVVTTIDASASIARYGRRSCPLEAPWTGGVNEAQDFCNAIAAAYWEPRTRIAVRLAASGEMERRHQIEREVSDRITVSEAETGFAGDCLVERIEHRISDAGWETVLSCERAVDASATFILDSVSNGVLGANALGY